MNRSNDPVFPFTKGSIRGFDAVSNPEIFLAEDFCVAGGDVGRIIPAVCGTTV
jgi:hypothetical protein